MMISPEAYIDSLKDLSYDELIVERDKLIKEIRAYENNKETNSEFKICPSPSTIYSVKLLYLSELLQYMHDKFIEQI